MRVTNAPERKPLEKQRQRDSFPSSLRGARGASTGRTPLVPKKTRHLTSYGHESHLGGRAVVSFHSTSCGPRSLRTPACLAAIRQMTSFPRHSPHFSSCRTAPLLETGLSSMWTTSRLVCCPR